MGYGGTPIDPDDSSLRLRHAVENRFPYPIARAFYQLRNTDDWLAEIPLLANVLGVALQHLATIALAEYLSQPERDAALNARLLDIFNKPISHGTWAGVLRETLTYLRARGNSLFMAPLLEEYFANGPGEQGPGQDEKERGTGIKEASDALVQMRNDLLKRAAGAIPNRSEAQRFKRQMMELMQLSGFLKDYQFVSGRSSRTQSGVKTHLCLIHMGFYDIFEHESVQCNLDLETGYPALLNARASELLYLYPFYALRECPKAGCGATHLFHFERLDSKGIEYAFEGEHHFRDADAGRDLQDLLRGEESSVPLRQTARYLYLQGVDARHRYQKLPNGSRVDGRYEVLEHLRRGGMADVYKARLVGSDTLLALKVLPFQFVSDRKMVQRFTQEATQAQELEHPNITRLIAYGDDLENYYIVMELATGWRVEGGQGKGRLALDVGELPKPMGEEAAIDVVQQACEGLYYIHRQGIIHRDIKPGNLLLFEGRQVKLADFGIARSREAMSLTSTGLAMGTPEYMSPEQVEGEGELTPASDIYSLGVVLYELLAGVVPFKRANLVAVMNAHKNATPPPLQDTNPAIPDGLQTIVMRCLEKDPTKRYRSARTLLRALIDYQESEEEVGAKDQKPEIKDDVSRVEKAEAPIEAVTPTQLPEPSRPYEVVAPALTLQPAQPSQLVELDEYLSHVAPAPTPQPAQPSKPQQPTSSDSFPLSLTSAYAPPPPPPKTPPHPYVPPPTPHTSTGPLAPTTPPPPTPQPTNTYAPYYVAGGLQADRHMTEQPATWSQTQVGSRKGKGLRWAWATMPVVAILAVVAVWTFTRPQGVVIGTSSKGTATIAPSTPMTAPTAAMEPTATSDVPEGTPLPPGAGPISPTNADRVIEFAEWQGHTNSVSSVAFSPYGVTLASGSDDSTVRLWRVSDGALLSTLEGRINSVSSVAFSPDGQTLASGSLDSTVRLWRVSDTP